MQLARLHRLVVITLLGFASGLPLALSGQAMQAWLTQAGLSLATIGFLTLVGLPYTFKFLWAPLIDRFDLPLFGRRRGWIALTQALLAAALWAISQVDPASQLGPFAALALLIAFLSASQDAAYDAYRADLLPAEERALGASLNTLGYRLAMIVSGGLAFIWVDANAGGGLSWPQVYRLFAALMGGAALLTLLASPRLPRTERPQTDGRRDLIGFAAVLVAVGLGVAFVQQGLAPALQAWLAPATPLGGRWVDLLVLACGLALVIPLAAWTARRAHYDTLMGGLQDYLRQPGAVAMLVLIVFYKLGDAFSVSLLTPFLLTGMHFSTAEVGVANKVFGLWLSIGGALLGGALMLRLGLFRALLLFAVLQGLSNLGYWWLAVAGQGQMGSVSVPAFDWLIVKLATATTLDGGLLAVIAVDNLCGGMGTAAFIAFMMALCRQAYSATQFALLSALSAVGRVWVGPLAGVLAEGLGWPSFFLLSLLFSLPALGLLFWLRGPISSLDSAK
ncbi:PAT family beta-lactamase induction signal transducer AmpG [Inhella inkyongensis]|uniref:PAT family beta-lactamase induction signal transducer AmpG n=1 Tax=Inhella inkyongensis TaxID=392593 RepID=A0A840RYU7_9BURK|nr:MFS transporter [Inhella inkyongensis]MBB5202723.1 PAT family beta-lactamase induction signal transducer AmpG [Inhella inkyongensis]